MSNSRGVTSTGKNLTNETRTQAMTVAVDPKVIPLGSKLLIMFKDAQHKMYSGIYKAQDTGGAIKGNKIDLYFGDFGDSVSQQTMDFGVASATIFIIK